MTEYTYTTQAQVRAAFWAMAKEFNLPVSRQKITDYSGRGKMYNTDTRTTFVDFVDSLERDGSISQALAERVTL